MKAGRIAIILARGGSKRIPQKNIKDFLGKPILTYSIETALKSGLFDEVMVSTDDDRIAAIAKQNGARVPFIRSQQNSGDYATTIDVIREVLAVYKEKFDTEFKYVCCIYATAPLIKTRHLTAGLQLLHNYSLSSVFPVVCFSYPIWRGLELSADQKPDMIWPEYSNSRSQDLKKVYHDAGQWYWFDPLKITSTLFTENSKSVILEETEVQDIDNVTDWKIAEMKYKLSNEA